MEKKPLRKTEDLAIIGISCRVPGANNYRDMWHNLCNGVESIRHYSDEELAEFGVPEEKRRHPHYIPSGGEFADVARFDANFFDYTPREAAKIDPSHRFFLECSWEALEDAGYADPNKKQNIGVYAGFMSVLCSYLMTYHTARPEIEGSTISSELFSLDRDYGATRVSYKLNLTGPAVNVQCACSTSLVAVHMACNSILAGDCEMALAGGASISPLSYLGYIRESGGPESEDGHVRAFDADASGTVFGRGVGVVLIKKLASALRDGDHIYAVIKSTSINNDGSLKDSFASPSSEGQRKCIGEAIEKACIDPITISYVLAHGTATLVGDPIEFQSLTEAFRKWTTQTQYCALGAIKPNLSHLDAAAGVMNLITSALALYYGKIPPLINFTSPNPKMDLARSPFYITTKEKKLPDDGQPKRALTTAFGVGGTNACAILEQAPRLPLDKTKLEAPYYLLPFSAKNAETLQREIDQFCAFLRHDPSASLHDIAYTLSTSRNSFSNKAAIVAASIEDARTQLENLKIQEQKTKTEELNPKIAYVFSGQGAQYEKMAEKLYQLHPLFKEWIDQCDQALEDILDVSLKKILFEKDDKTLAQTCYTQPALFAVEYSLFKLLESWGLKPDFVLGHSLGEYVAAAASGAMSFKDGIRLAALRGKLIQNLPEGGGMAAVAAPPEFIENSLKTYLIAHPSVKLDIAGYNSSRQTVLAGKKEELTAFTEHLALTGITSVPLPVSHAFHSFLLDPILPSFEKIAAQFSYQEFKIPLISNVTGKRMDNMSLSPSYWVKHMRSPVQFVESIKTLAQEGCTIFVEIGPHPILLNTLKDTLERGKNFHFIPTLRKNNNDWKQMLHCLSGLYSANVQIDWKHFFAAFGGSKVSLPNYPFEKKSHWVEPSNEAGWYGKALPQGLEQRGPLIGHQVATPFFSLFENIIDWNNPSQMYIKDHVIVGYVLYPGAGFVELMAEAAKIIVSPSFRLDNITISRPLPLTSEENIRIQTIIEQKDTSREISIYSCNVKAEWIRHCSATVMELADEHPAALHALPPLLLSSPTNTENKSAFYEARKAEGLHYGPLFQPLEKYIIEKNTCWAHLKLPSMPYKEIIHPVLLDGCFQLFALLDSQCDDYPLALKQHRDKFVLLPTHIDSLLLYQELTPEVIVHVHTPSFQEEKTVKINVDVYSIAGEMLLRVEGATFTITNRREFSRHLASSRLHNLLYTEDWEEQTLEKVTAPPICTFLIFTLDPKEQMIAELTEQLKKMGHTILTVSHGKDFQKISEDAIEMPLFGNEGYSKLWDHLKNTKNVKILNFLLYISQEKKDLTYDILNDVVSKPLKSCFHLLQETFKQNVLPSVPLYSIGKGFTSQVPNSSCAQSTLLGMLRSLTLEFPAFPLVLIDIDFSTSLTQALPLLTEEILTPTKEREVLFRSGKRFVNRIIRYKEWANKHLTLTLPVGSPFRLIKGKTQMSLDHLAFKEFSPEPPANDEVEIAVRAVGLNFRDLLNALNLYPGDAGLLGSDCSGEIIQIGKNVKNFKKGDFVLGFSSGALGNFAKAKTQALIAMPTTMSFSEAATIPTIFLTAHHALIKLAKIKKGDKVLIHAAAGGVGLSAIQIAQHAGAEIFATCSSDAKRNYLESLGVKHIFNSRSIDFAEDIRKNTHSKGVDVVLNSLSGEGFIEASLSVLKEGGRFLEIGKRNIWTKEEMAAKRPDVSYFIIALDDMIANHLSEIHHLFKEVMAKFYEGIYTPIPHASYPLTNVKEALHFLQKAQHIGKVVVESPPIWQEHIKEGRSYLITGGLGGIGLTMAEWLIDKGANKLILLGRHGPDQEAASKIQTWRAKGVNIVVRSVDISKSKEVAAFFKEFSEAERKELAGVIHAAGILKVDMFIKSTWDFFIESFNTKVFGSLFIHDALIAHKITLDFLMHFSSASSMIGVQGQAGYCAANSFLDSFGQYELHRGIPTITLNWAIWKEVGMGAVYEKRHAASGFHSIDNMTAISEIELALEQQLNHFAVMDLDTNVYLEKMTENDQRMNHLKEENLEQQKEKKEGNLIQKLKTEPPLAWPPIIASHLEDVIRSVLGVSQSTPIDPKTIFYALGIDSLARNELIAKLEKSFDYKERFDFNLIVTYPTIEALSTHLAERFASHINQK